MISKIAVINSEIYSKAILQLDTQKDIKCIQLVAENNVGKSSLINTLNFLFILDGRHMKFGGDYDLKTSIKHYFPLVNHSFIAFEIYKPKVGYFCILIKRSPSANGQLDYYHIKGQFKESYFFKKEKDKTIPLSFNEINKKYLLNGISCDKVDKRKLYDFVYNRDKKKSCVVWLNDRTKRHGSTNSNNFNQIYRYLINTNLISDDRLKEAIIIANNRQNERVSFAEGGKDDLLKIERLSKEIQQYKEIRSEDYDAFKNIYQDYNNLRNHLGKIRYNFNYRYDTAIKKLREDISTLEKEEEEIGELILNIEKQKEELTLFRGSKKNTKDNLVSEISTLTGLLTKVETLEIENQLNPFRYRITDVEQKVKKLERQLDDIDSRNYTENFLKKEVNKLQRKYKNLEQKILKYDDLLIQHISDDKEIQEFLNGLFSSEVLHLSKDNIIQKINKISDKLKIFDGVIKVENIEKKPLETVLELKEELRIITIDLTEKEEILKTLQKKKAKEEEVKKMKVTIQELSEKEFTLSKKEEYEVNKNKLKQHLANINTELLNSINEIDALKHELGTKRKKTENFRDKKRNIQGWITRYQKSNEEFKTYPAIEIKEIQSKLTLSNCIDMLNRGKRELNDLNSQSTNLFNKLKRIIKSDLADIDVFIKTTDEELLLIAEKEDHINAHLQNISNQFTGSVKNLLDSYEEFKAFKKTFNRQIGDYQISNISNLRIELLDTSTELENLEKISQIRGIQANEINFETPLLSHSDALKTNLDILKKYIDEGKVVEFKELFDLQLVLEKDEKTKKVNIGKQVESEGTDRMIKLVLFLSIIKHLVVKDNDNKIAIYIDELGKIGQRNVTEIVNFCVQNNFIPIFAAPRPIEGIDKYYIIKPSHKNKKIVIDEDRAEFLKGKKV